MEIICDRQRNNYETSLNAFGNIFTSDNDDDGNRGCRVIQAFDGGHYGYHTSLRLHWGEEIPGTVPKLVGTGNGSPCGIMVYEGGLLPKEYLGAVLEADAGTRQINLFPLTRHASTFRTDYKVFLASDDPWFRPVDMTAAPDGAVFVADWYDAGVGGHSFRDQTTGRIYRVVPKGSKAKAPKLDLKTVHGLIEALKSPVVATQDVARRLLLERAGTEREKVEPEVVRLYSEGAPIEKARALWVLYQIAGPRAAVNALKSDDPQIRAQAVRMLGRDDRENGHVEYKNPEAKRPAVFSGTLDALLPLAADPDAGVRRELVLALRTLPTEKVGNALKALSRSWDGQDRWYLESLAASAWTIAKAAFIAELFDGTLYGDLDLDVAGQASRLAEPPYFPVDRNEAYIAVGTKDLPASGAVEDAGLDVRRPPARGLCRCTPAFCRSSVRPDLQQAADDILAQMRDPATAVVVADLAEGAGRERPGRKREFLVTLGRKLGGDWKGARQNPVIERLIDRALEDPETRLEAVQMVATIGGPRYMGILERFARDAKAPPEVRVSAVEALSVVKAPESQTLLDRMIGETRGKSSSNPVAEAAVRTIPQLYQARDHLRELFLAGRLPPGLRRERSDLRRGRATAAEVAAGPREQSPRPT